MLHLVLYLSESLISTRTWYFSPVDSVYQTLYEWTDHSSAYILINHILPESNLQTGKASYVL